MTKQYRLLNFIIYIEIIRWPMSFERDFRTKGPATIHKFINGKMKYDHSQNVINFVNGDNQYPII
jgi:hypothetical protein